MTPESLSKRIVDFVFERTDSLVTRFLPQFVIPRFFCGHWRSTDAEEATLIFLLAYLHRLDVPRVAGVPIEQAIAKLLRHIDGAKTETFYSMFVADSLLTFGSFQSNPLLTDFTLTELDNVRAATDTTHIYEPATNSIGGWANNYWAVLARCELARKRLGILTDEAILQHSIEQLKKLLFANSLGFFNDGKSDRGRYDIYSADVHLFCEPLWTSFEPNKINSNLRQHTLLIEKIAMENGASFDFGRSIGALSICLTIEYLAMAIAQGLTQDAYRSLRLAEHAFVALTTWFQDDLITAHRRGNTEGYRGIHRVLQMTLDCLAKLCYAAEKLRKAKPSPTSSSFLFPDIDELIPFDADHGGIWMFRNDHLAFQLPLTDGYNADYAPWLRNPGLFENPVDSLVFCGVPRIAKGAAQFTTCGLPSQVEKSPGALTVTHEKLHCVSGKCANTARGRRVATCRVDGDTLYLDEDLSFDASPDALSYVIPETERPLDVEFTSACAFYRDTIAVDGMAEWRSPWGELKTLHQAHFVPERRIRFTCRIRPKLRVCPTPGRDHDYIRGLFERFSPRDIVESPPIPGSLRAADVDRFTRDTDIIHVGWPEHLLANNGLEEADFDRQIFEFIEALDLSEARIVWTMHNRRPHWWAPERGKRLYAAWARIADAMIHHSEWGMKRALQEYPYDPNARHIVLPHGHYREQMQVTRSRPEIEAALGLPPCGTRFGLLGRAQAEKRIEMILRAFQKGARADQQLVVTAYDDKTPRPQDPRIFFISRKPWMSREDIANSTHVCDALVSAHFGESYYTSGLCADSIGAAVPMLAPQWEFFHETFGDAAFYHENTEESLAALFAFVSKADLESKRAMLLALQPKSEWSLLAEKTLELYRSLGRKWR